MKRVLLAAVVCGSLFASSTGLMGCKDDRGNAGTTGGTAKAENGTTAVAVVDMTKVARDLGWISQLDTSLKTYGEQLQTDLKKFQQLYRAQIQGFMQTLVPKDAKPNDKITLTPEQQQQLSQLISNANQTIQGLDQQAGQLYNNYRVASIRLYREQLTPLVRQVAQEKKFVTVLEQTDNILFSEPAVDLTNAVVDAAKGKAAPPALKMDELKGPPSIGFDLATGTTQPTTQPATKPAK